MGGGGGCCIGNCCIGNCCIGNFNCCVLNFGKKSSGSSSGGRTESYDSNTAELEATVKVQNALTEFRKDTLERSTTLENDIIKESREYLDEFIEELRKYNKMQYKNKRMNINIEHIQRENRKTEDKIHGFIVGKVSKRVSLDDSECCEILKLNPGKEKEKKLDEFYKKVVKKAVKDLSKELQNSMETQTDIVEEHLQRRIDGIVDICETKTKDFENIQKLKESESADMELEQLRLSYLVAMCEYGISQI